MASCRSWQDSTLPPLLGDDSTWTLCEAAKRLVSDQREANVIGSSHLREVSRIQQERPQPLEGMSTPAPPVCGRSGSLTVTWCVIARSCPRAEPAARTGWQQRCCGLCERAVRLHLRTFRADRRVWFGSSPVPFRQGTASTGHASAGDGSRSMGAGLVEGDAFLARPPAAPRLGRHSPRPRSGWTASRPRWDGTRRLSQSLASWSVAVRPALVVRSRKSASSWSWSSS